VTHTIEAIEQKIRQQIYENYDLKNDLLHGGICNKCRGWLIHTKEGKTWTRKTADFVPVQPPMSTRSTKHEDTCKICKIACIPGLSQEYINMVNAWKVPLSDDISTSSTTRRLCEICWSSLYPGCTHECSLTTRLTNLKKMTTEVENSKRNHQGQCRYE